MTTKELIEAASKRLLTKAEEAELTLGLWKGTKAEFIATVNKAYGTAKNYDLFGGIKYHHDLMALFTKLGSDNFGVLYNAVKLAKTS